jgi:hypothetical protein
MSLPTDELTMRFARVLRHLFATPWIVRRAFPQRALDGIEAAIHASETRHCGEIRFAVEGALEFVPVVRGLTPRARALDLFSLLRVWDTEQNTGVLIYVQLVDHRIEIVADRGISRRVAQHEWDAICARMQEAYGTGQYEAGTVAGIAQVSEILVRHFPAADLNEDELPNKPVML